MGECKLNVEWIFSNLKSKFIDIDMKINTKIKSVNAKHDADVEKINSIFDKEIAIPMDEAGINDQREHLLKKIWQNCNNHLQEITKLFHDFDKNLDLVKLCNADQYNVKVEIAKEVLMQNYEEIKKNFFHFLPLRRQNYAPILKKSKFKKPFDLAKLNKYFHLAAASRSRFLMPKDYYFMATYHVLPSKQGVMCVTINETFKDSIELVIINKDGLILHYCELPMQSVYAEMSIKVSPASILVYLKFENQTGLIFDMYEKSLVQIYDFKLNIINSFELYCYNFNEFMTPNNQALFQNNENKQILVYDLDYFKTTYISTQCQRKDEAFYIQFTDTLIHLNENYLYFIRKNMNELFDYMYIMIRKTGFKLVDIQLKARFARNSITFDNQSNIYDLDRSQKAVSLYSSRGNFLKCIVLCDRIRIDMFSYFDTIILNVKNHREHDYDYFKNIENLK